MLLDQVFNSVPYTKTIFVRKNGKLSKVKKPLIFTREPESKIEQPLFPISKDRDPPNTLKEKPDETKKD
jgi:hypothetical protein